MCVASGIAWRTYNVTSIRRHLMLRLALALAAGGLLLGFATYEFTRQEMNDVFDEQLRQLAVSVRTHYRGEVSVPLLTVGTAADLEDSGFVTQIWSLEKQRVFLSFPAADIPWMDNEGYQILETPQGAWRVYAERTPTHLIQAAQMMGAREDLAIDTAVEILLPNLMVTLALIAVLLAFALRRGLAPLAQTSAEVGTRSAASLEPMATAALPAELLPLVESVNALMARLALALSAQRRFTADAAHALRTPLAALRLQVQLLDKATSPVMRQEALADIYRGLDRATHLVEQLLHLARLAPDAGDRPLHAVDLARLVKSVVADFSVLAHARGIDLGAEIVPMAAGAAQVRGDTQHLRMLLDNLVGNALQYTPRGGKVDVALRVTPTGATLEVADSGPGIPLAERERVFDRFFRGTASHGTEGATQGTGLGLAIVREVAQRHGASILLLDGLPAPDGMRGLTVRLSFAAQNEIRMASAA